MHFWSNTHAAPQKIGILLFDRFSNLCLANCLEPMRAANMFAGRRIYAWQFLTLDGALVRSSSDLPVMPDASLDRMPQSDALIVLVSYDHIRHDTAKTRRMLRAAARKTRVMIGFDSAAWLMASAGLLDGYRATLHRDISEDFSERFHEVELQDSRYVIDRNRITCAGAMAAFGLMHDLIGSHLGQSIATDIEALFLASDALAQQDVTAKDPIVMRALSEMRATLETPLLMHQLARRVGTSPKTLARRFETALGTSPGRTYQHIRLSAAHQMLVGSTTSIAEIAVRCGYENPSALTRAFKARFGVPPSTLRRSGV
ncbi:MAG: GlxA family transcriptional regulator [Rhodobacteraceae bacterium]|nr:GlxA family transcriptional regulator [Paracoccaceae bacterium]